MRNVNIDYTELITNDAFRTLLSFYVMRLRYTLYYVIIIVIMKLSRYTGTIVTFDVLLNFNIQLHSHIWLTLVKNTIPTGCWLLAFF